MTLVAKDIFIVGAKRTPFGKYGGLLSEFSITGLQSIAAKSALNSAGVKSHLVDSVIVGNVHSASSPDGRFAARHVALKLGIPVDKPAYMVNRLCGSSFQSIINGVQGHFVGGQIDLIKLCYMSKDLDINRPVTEIISDSAEIVLTGGVENMSSVPYSIRNIRFGIPLGTTTKLEEPLLGIDTYCGLTMALTAEKLGDLYKITRKESDEYSLRSQRLWKSAHDAGYFAQELAPVHLKIKGEEVIMNADEHPRPNSTIDRLTKLPSIFKQHGLVTAGSASGVCDGAGAVLLASERAAVQNNLKILGRIIAYSVVGVDPSIMGIGPVPAIRNVLKASAKTLNDIDIIEINEAFAAQTLACVKELNLDTSKLNVNGGAIAVGHPLGASGTRIMTHLVYELRRRKARYGIGSACIGGGQGIALLIESL